MILQTPFSSLFKKRGYFKWQKNQKHRKRSSEFIDTVTFNRISDESLLNLYKEKIQKCTCALSEMLFRRNMISDSNLENIPKISETIGSYSVKFANPLEYVQEMSMSDSDFRKSMKNTALQYLGNTDLMYRGVD